ncbi:SAM-dependent methyltransferase [Corynebacterium frankenforstense DSM 45800]|uniref:SAM-dependent methyltransferase n=1 Tax=Corynebacterium frankenforstense DSM 45800 TaxID=1437875 RepID=A0A1L7CSP8_9CORY|nr:class I SAM-dependent methyltransferase [Corynebacterium frankenforstense]APT88870.1 SAM-dependent methyltransferase [Corynebacterium frankenforstense DSM 45800]
MATWKQITEANPMHSENYAARWRNFVAEGRDIDGEARLVDAVADRGARILDAGCGTGRVAGYLAARGHHVVGTDLDPVLIGYARRDFPDVRFEVGDLETDEIPEGNFDVAVSAGNVMGFLSEEGREPALANIARSLRPGGRFLVGFGLNRGWAAPDFLDTAARAGFELQNAYESWQLDPYTPMSGFLVAILARR